MSKSEKDWKEKLLELKASGALPGEKESISNAKFQAQAVSRNSATGDSSTVGEAPLTEHQIASLSIKALQAELTNLKSRLRTAEGERNQLRLKSEAQDIELQRMNTVNEESRTRHDNLLRDIQRHRIKFEQLEGEIGPILEENDCTETVIT